MSLAASWPGPDPRDPGFGWYAVVTSVTPAVLFAGMLLWRPGGVLWWLGGEVALMAVLPPLWRKYWRWRRADAAPENAAGEDAAPGDVTVILPKAAQADAAREASQAAKWRRRRFRDNRDPATSALALGVPHACWCGRPHGHDWAGKGDGAPHPRGQDSNDGDTLTG